MPMGQLTQVLRGIVGEPDERLVVGPSSLDDAGVVRLSAEEILSASDRAAHLTGQLLAFGRRRPMRREVVDVSAFLRSDRTAAPPSAVPECATEEGR